MGNLYHWLVRILVVTILSTLFSLVGLSPSVALAQTNNGVREWIDTKEHTFSFYGLQSLDALLTEHAREEIRNGRMRPVLSTFLHPARYGLIAAEDARYAAVSPTQILCLNRGNHSLQLACHQEDGHRTVIVLSNRACARNTPIPALLPAGCTRPYISTIEGKRVQVRLAQRANVPSVPDMSFGNGSEAAAIMAPAPEAHPIPPETPSRQPIASPRGPPAAQEARLAFVQPPPTQELERLRRQNGWMRRIIIFTAVLLALAVLIYALAYWLSPSKFTPQEEEDAPDVTMLESELSKARSANTQLAQERASALEEKQEAQARASKAEQRVDELNRENARLQALAHTEEQARKEVTQREAQLRAELTKRDERIATLVADDLRQRDALRQAREDLAASERERIALSARILHAERQTLTLEQNQERLTSLSHDNDQLSVRIRDLNAENKRLLNEVAMLRATRHSNSSPNIPVLENEPRHTFPQDLSREATPQETSGTHPTFDPTSSAADSTRRLSPEETRALRETSVMPDERPEQPPPPSEDIDFGNLLTDDPFRENEGSTAVPNLDPSEDQTRVMCQSGVMSPVRGETKAYTPCPTTLANANPNSPRAMTTAMSIAEQRPLIALTRPPLDDDAGPTAPPHNDLAALADMVSDPSHVAQHPSLHESEDDKTTAVLKRLAGESRSGQAN